MGVAAAAGLCETLKAEKLQAAVQKRSNQRVGNRQMPVNTGKMQVENHGGNMERTDRWLNTGKFWGQNRGFRRKMATRSEASWRQRMKTCRQ